MASVVSDPGRCWVSARREESGVSGGTTQQSVSPGMCSSTPSGAATSGDETLLPGGRVVMGVVSEYIHTDWQTEVKCEGLQWRLGELVHVLLGIVGP